MGTAEIRIRPRRGKEILVPKIEGGTHQVRSYTISSKQGNVISDKVTNSYYPFLCFFNNVLKMSIVNSHTS